MAYRTTVETDIGVVQIVCTDRSDGDFAVTQQASEVEQRRSSIQEQPWTWLRQIHSARVLEVTHPGEHSGREADGSLTRSPACPLSVTTADCGPVVLVADNGIAVVHAGWRGALDGIVEVAANRLLKNGASPVKAFVGPTIGSHAYEFTAADLRPFVDRYGTEVASETSQGLPALDMAKVIEAACAQVGFEATRPLACTSEPNRYSYRLRKEAERQATVAWIDG